MFDELRKATRREVGARVFEGLFNTASRLGNLHPASRPARHHVERLRDVRYRPGTLREHTLDVYRPLPLEREAAPAFRRHHGPSWPVVFYVHGGSFSILSKDTHWVMALAFARQGYLVFNVSYRLAPKHRYPAAIDDVCTAFAWVAENAHRYGGDASRVVLAGESAGANLAASLAIALTYERHEPYAQSAFATGIVPRAVVPACGVFQVSDMQRLVRRKPSMPGLIADRLLDLEATYLGSPPFAASLDLVDCANLLERGDRPARPLPPFFLPVGTRDPLLPDTRRLAAALRAHGATVEDRYYPGELHAFHALVMRPAARQCWQDTHAFLGEHVPV